jgi:hypothetical protein
VVVAVYNTMPYLERTLSSLVEQSIGASRLQVIAVDDGSTDDSAETLDRFAAEHPTVFTVIHQPNSGGPALPSNRALEIATGRYVYFLGADDYLGPEALERMVDFADQHGSDVVIGRMVGVNGREVGQGLFGADEVDLDPYGPGLRWALANTKLFRRELVERLGLRYREDMPFGSDQPFTLAACVHAKRISVLASYACYYAVKREDSSNLSYNTSYADRVPCIGQMMQAVADLVPAGPHRDTILTRHFAWEIPRLLRADLLERPAPEQLEVCAGIRRLTDSWLNEAIIADLPVSARVRVTVAALEDVEMLAAVIREDTDPDLPVLFENGQAFACYTGFRASPLPEHLFRLAPPGVAGRLSEAARVVGCRWTRRALQVEIGLPVAGEVDSVLSARLGDRPAFVTADEDRKVVIEVPRESLLVEGAGTFRLQLLGELAHSVPSGGRFQVRLPKPPVQQLGRTWHRGRPYRVSVVGTPRGRGFAVVVSPIPAREIVGAVRRRLRSKRK